MINEHSSISAHNETRANIKFISSEIREMRTVNGRIVRETKQVRCLQCISDEEDEDDDEGPPRAILGEEETRMQVEGDWSERRANRRRDSGSDSDEGLADSS